MNKPTFFRAHRKAIVFVAFLAIAGGGYWYYQSKNQVAMETKYVMSAAAKGTVVATVSGTGQVSASNQFDVKPEASGNLTRIAIVQGQTVKTGDLLARIDDRDAQKTVRDALTSLESAQLSLEKLTQPVDQLSLIQSENALAQAKENQLKVAQDLEKAYEDGYNDVANAFLDLPDVMNGVYGALFNSTASRGQQANLDYYADGVRKYDESVQQYRDDANSTYQSARTAYDANFDAYKRLGRDASKEDKLALINQTYQTSIRLAESLKSASNLIQFYEDKLTEHGLKPVADADTQLVTLNNLTGKVSAHISSLLADTTAVDSANDAIVNAGRSVIEKQESLDKLKAGADPLDIKSQQLSIQQRQNALRDARENLAKYAIYAPADGIVTTMTFNKGDSVSSGTVFTSIISKQQVAEISLNEVDMAKIKVGQKVTVTFDAIEGLDITGQVAQIDTMGSVSQGVVSYAVKIAFDTQDDRVRPGMSVTAAVITNVATDVLTVPNAAIKTGNSGYYVEVFPGLTPDSQNQVASATAPSRQAVEIGLANDTLTEVTSGLKEGDLVVTRTIASTTATTTQNRSIINFGGGGNRGAATTTNRSSGNAVFHPPGD